MQTKRKRGKQEQKNKVSHYPSHPIHKYQNFEQSPTYLPTYLLLIITIIPVSPSSWVEKDLQVLMDCIPSLILSSFWLALFFLYICTYHLHTYIERKFGREMVTQQLPPSSSSPTYLPTFHPPISHDVEAGWLKLKLYPLKRSPALQYQGLQRYFWRSLKWYPLQHIMRLASTYAYVYMYVCIHDTTTTGPPNKSVRSRAWKIEERLDTDRNIAVSDRPTSDRQQRLALTSKPSIHWRKTN